MERWSLCLYMLFDVLVSWKAKRHLKTRECLNYTAAKSNHANQKWFDFQSETSNLSVGNPPLFWMRCSPFITVRFSVNFHLAQQNTAVIISNDICILKHNKTTLYLDEEWLILKEKLRKNQVIKREFPWRCFYYDECCDIFACQPKQFSENFERVGSVRIH